MNSKPVWKIEKIVLPQHADHAGVMWHGKYFNWLEESRINALSEVGISYFELTKNCLLYTSPSPRDRQKSRMPSSA